MKTLKLKKLGQFDYKTNLLGILQNAPAKGYTVDEVRKAVKAIEALKEAKEEVQFEDDIWEFVKKSVNEASYIIATPELVAFLDEFK